MTKKTLLFGLSLLSFFSLFLPATLKPNSQTFQLDKISFFKILMTRPNAAIFILSALLFVIIAFNFLSQSRVLALGLLIGAYYQFIISYVNWSYLGNQFFSIYLYGFWLQLILTTCIFIVLGKQLRQ
ncbi:hypothetical protein RU86_GL001927 [Lactococcus piscium]|uniref:Uncharacterized protein n=1 Tax=Pseudolactococcus piscium TaxID=1364 RepID=A0A2A5S346_9LACT|nr:hypothetical protein [Lactococcus piscium]PCS07870.1 hypothetical protein RU86_GL001927 [Lactococcus piscium]